MFDVCTVCRAGMTCQHDQHNRLYTLIYILCVDSSVVNSTTAMLEHLKVKHPGELDSHWIWQCGQMPQVGAVLWYCHSMVCVCDGLGTPADQFARLLCYQYVGPTSDMFSSSTD